MVNRALIVILANAFYIVSLDQQAIVLRFGQYQYAVNADGSPRGAGLHFKVPVVENVVYYDKRNMGFDLDSAEIIAADQQRLNVDAIARWRIKDPTQFFRAASTMDNGLAQLRQRFKRRLRTNELVGIDALWRTLFLGDLDRRNLHCKATVGSRLRGLLL